MTYKGTNKWLEHMAKVRLKFPKLSVPKLALKARLTYKK